MLNVRDIMQKGSSSSSSSSNVNTNLQKSSHNSQLHKNNIENTSVNIAQEVVNCSQNPNVLKIVTSGGTKRRKI